MKIDKVCIIGIFFSLFLLTGCGSDESEPSTPARTSTFRG